MRRLQSLLLRRLRLGRPLSPRLQADGLPKLRRLLPKLGLLLLQPGQKLLLLLAQAVALQPKFLLADAQLLGELRHLRVNLALLQPQAVGLSFLLQAQLPTTQAGGGVELTRLLGQRPPKLGLSAACRYVELTCVLTKRLAELVGLVARGDTELPRVLVQFQPPHAGRDGVRAVRSGGRVAGRLVGNLLLLVQAGISSGQRRC